MSPSSPAESSEQVEPLHLETAPALNPVNSHVPDGLVPAGQLPSAADVLAQLLSISLNVSSAASGIVPPPLAQL